VAAFITFAALRFLIASFAAIAMTIVASVVVVVSFFLATSALARRSFGQMVSTFSSTATTLSFTFALTTLILFTAAVASCAITRTFSFAIARTRTVGTLRFPFFARGRFRESSGFRIFVATVRNFVGDGRLGHRDDGHRFDHLIGFRRFERFRGTFSQLARFSFRFFLSIFFRVGIIATLQSVNTTTHFLVVIAEHTAQGFLS